MILSNKTILVHLIRACKYREIVGIIAAGRFLRKQVKGNEPGDYGQVYGRAQKYQLVSRGGLSKSFNHALRLIHA
jgi:hypothetical protein